MDRGSIHTVYPRKGERHCCLQLWLLENILMSKPQVLKLWGMKGL